MENIKIKIEYDGTDFNGWQIQPDVRTVQGEIQKTISKVIGTDIRIQGAGRTDAGVHGLGQVASLNIDTRIPVDRLMKVFNNHLPEDITIKELVVADKDFHARYSACGKHYQYRIYNECTRNSLIRNYYWHIEEKLNIEEMLKAIPFLIGERDYRCFMSSGSSVQSTVRTVHEIDLVQDGQFITIDFKGNGFLYNMVRNMTRLLIDIGIGKEKIDNIKNILEGSDRSLIGSTAPPQGLYLVEVYY